MIPVQFLFVVAQCKKKWTCLRDGYRKAVKKRKPKSGDPKKKFKKWKYEDVMTFMIPFFSEREQKSNLDSDESEEETNDLIEDEEQDVERACSQTTEGENTTLLNNDNGCGNHRSQNSERASSRNSSSHCSASNSTTTDFPPTPSTSKSDSRRDQLPPMAQVLKNYFDHKQTTKLPKQSDHLHKFFDAMQETVRSFAPALQIEIKSKISQLVTEYERRNLKMQQSAQQDSSNQPQHYFLSFNEQSFTPTFTNSIQDIDTHLENSNRKYYTM